METQKGKQGPGQTHQRQNDNQANARRNPIVDVTAQKYNYQEVKKQLAEERRKEYNDLLRAKEHGRAREKEKEIDEPKIIPFDRAEQDKERLRILEEERKREYNQVKAQMDEKHRNRREHTPQDNLGLPVGEYEKRRQKELEQRQYREMLQRQQEEKKRLLLIQEMGVPPEKVPEIMEKEKQRAGAPQQRQPPPPPQEPLYREEKQYDNDQGRQIQYQYSQSEEDQYSDYGHRKTSKVQFQSPDFREPRSPQRRSPERRSPQRRSPNRRYQQRDRYHSAEQDQVE
ncbi:inner centromere protein-like isoform X2 [Aplysia californica]|uniref:Inner centromere protein-like isoform X1 n=1 Tax=Aplysia californica TaxID=6500 RepID=A0ABM1VS62_APLCA|nr:inner centromere protein-like isoform X1 [Aplysia californica]XP_035825254.1 inner centromere protein-like isoform X2 [Aplysia californica]